LKLTVRAVIRLRQSATRAMTAEPIMAAWLVPNH